MWKVLKRRGWDMYSIFTAVLLISICGYSVSKIYGFALVPDEFGYWTYAADIAGYDWSDIASLGSYYSYGYSLLLLPVFVMCKSGVIAYRMAIALNFMLLVVTFFMLRGIAEKLFGKLDSNMRTLFVTVAVLYPPLMLFAKTTMAETVLAAAYVAICALIHEYFQKNKTSTLIVLMVVSVYIYFVHMRAVGITIACMTTFILNFLDKKKIISKKTIRQLGLAIIIVCLLLVAGYAIKRFAVQNIYSTADSARFQYNDYAGQIGKIKYIFTLEGIKDFAISLSGKLLYLGMASFGLAYWGIWYALKSRRNPFFIFILLSTLAETLINAIYTVNPLRIDSLAYGRYHEFVVPVLMMIGLYAMWQSGHKMIGAVAIVISQFPMTAFVSYSVEHNQIQRFLPCMISGMSYAYGWGEFEPEVFYWKAYIIGSALTVLLALTVYIMARKKWEFILVVVAAAEIALYLMASRLCIDAAEKGAYRDTVVARRIEQLCQNYDRRVIYIDDDDDYSFICILQFMMRDKDILIYEKGSEELIASDLVLLDYRSPYAEELKDQYSELMVYGHYALCYNIKVLIEGFD